MRASIAAIFSCSVAIACGGTQTSASVAPGQHSLHIAVTGRGAVRAPAIGAECSNDCRLEFASGAAVHLEAVPQTGATFTGWSGACSGTGTCDVTLDRDTDVEATFQGGPPTDPPPPAPPPPGSPPPSPAPTPAPAPPPSGGVITLRVQWTGDGEGTVIGDVGRCDTTCTRTPFSPGTRVAIDAVAEPGSAFAGWGGPCSGSGQCRFLMNQDTTVIVSFKKLDQPRYSVLQLSAIVGPGTQPVAMNANGQVVGNGPRGPWIFDPQAGAARNVLPEYETRTFVANGISARGDVALDLVGEDAAGKATHRAFLFTAGRLVDLGTLGAPYSTAKAVNSAGLVAGDSQLVSGEFRAFLFDGAMRNLGTLGGANDSLAFAINEKGWVTGQAQLADGTRHAFLYDGAMRDLGSLGGAFARGQAVNEKGQVAGMSSLDPGANEPVHAFFHDGTSMRDLGVLPGLPWSSATGLNNQGVVVGNVYAEIQEDDYDTHAFVFRDGKMWDLNELIPPSPFRLFTSLAIDDSGRILCTDGQVGQMPANGYLLIPQ